MHKYDNYHIKESLKVMSQRNTLWDYMVGRVASCNAICHQWQIFTWESCPGAIIKVQCCNNKVFNEVSLFKFPYIIYYVTCFVILYSVFVIYSFGLTGTSFGISRGVGTVCLLRVSESESAKKFTNCPAPPVRETLPKAKRTRGLSDLDNLTTWKRHIQAAKT